MRIPLANHVVFECGAMRRTWMLLARNVARYSRKGGWGERGPQVSTRTSAFLSAARRNGGLFKTVTNLDTTSLNSLLPGDTELSMRNFVGAQMSAWGVLAMFFPATRESSHVAQSVEHAAADPACHLS